MTTFGISLAASVREPITRIADLTAAAEERGFSYAYFLDSQMAFKDVYVTMAMAATKTRSIRIGTGVTNPITRDLTVTAGSIAAINEISQGRCVLGFGNGASAVEGIGLQGANLRGVSNALKVLRGLLDGEPVVHNGVEIKMQPARPRVPIYASASRPKMLELAGKLADGVILMGSAHPALLQQQLDDVFTGLRESGRDRRDFHVDLWQTISLSDDKQQALEDVKSWVASQLVWWFGRATQPLPPELRDRIDWEKLEEANRSYEITEHLSLHAKHRELVTEDLADIMAIAGDEQHCVARLRELSRLDVDTITLSLLSGGREQRLERLGDAIASVRG